MDVGGFQGADPLCETVSQPKGPKEPSERSRALAQNGPNPSSTRRVTTPASTAPVVVMAPRVRDATQPLVPTLTKNENAPAMRLT